jgi:phospholipid/cholesterol/gamma-HCH transport system substrate-binding protein
MTSNVTETVIGAVVLVAAAGFILFAGQMGGVAPRSDNYVLKANFMSAEGIGVGTDVRLAGVKIGSVVGLDLNHSTYEAETQLAIQNDVLIPDDSDVKIASEGLLGGSFVEVTPGASDFMLNNGEEILLTQGAVSFLSLLMKFVAEESE